MTHGPGRGLLAVADDLSGAAETAAVLLSRTTRSRVVLSARSAAPGWPGEVTVVDLDSRHAPPGEAAGRVRAALAAAGPATPVFKKIDSLLRGNVAAETAALAEDGAGVIVAAALPLAGRTVRGGVVHTGGTALHLGGAWHAEAVPAPRSVAEALGVPVTPVGLDAVRGPRDELRAAVREALATGRPVVCDAETDADLDAVLAAVRLPAAGPPGSAPVLDPRLRLVGSGGLAQALGRLLAEDTPPTATPRHEALATRVPREHATAPLLPGPAALPSPPGPVTPTGAHGRAGAFSPHGYPGAGPLPGSPAAAPPPESPLSPPPHGVSGGDRPVLVVVGTAEPSAGEQVGRLTADGAAHLALPPRSLAPDALVPPSLTLSTGVTVLALGRDGRPDPSASRRLVRGLAEVASAAVRDHPGPVDLVLTGGETARRVLDALGVTELEPFGQIHHGAVASRTPDGRTVVTRPGSFGDPDSLRHIVRALRPPAGTTPAGPAPTQRKARP